MTPVEGDSSAVLNAVWGSTNAAVAWALGWRYRSAVGSDTLAVAFATGIALALWFASFWGNDRGEPTAETSVRP